VDLPIWVPRFTQSRSSAGGPEEPKHFEAPILQRRGYTQDVETVEGIGFVNARKLRRVGVCTVDDLLQMGYTKTGRDYLAKQVGVSQATVSGWVAAARKSV
jgi:predicted flap endonuclease-1-like 5' DNA nuclease